MDLPKTTLVGYWQRTKMYTSRNSSKGCRQGVESNFARREIELLSYVVANEVGERT